MTTICLCMIVKDEVPVIERCLRSALPLVDIAVIVDTGSTDDTYDKMTPFDENPVPVDVHFRPWVNFSHNRNEAITIAKESVPEVDYLLFLDADEVLTVPEGFKWPELTADAYWLPVDYGGTHYLRCALVKSSFEMRYVGAVHEYLELPEGTVIERLDAPTIRVFHDGARARDPQTYAKDAALLLEAHRKDPADARTVFYLAQSHRDAGKPFAARDWYLKRAAMGGWAEEQWMALYEAAKLTEIDDPEMAVNYYLRAYQMRPARAEPLYQLARLFRGRRDWHVAWMFAMAASHVMMPVGERLFLDPSIYKWRIHDEIGILGFYAGHPGMGQVAAEYALANCPPEERERIAANRAFYDAPAAHLRST